MYACIYIYIYIYIYDSFTHVSLVRRQLQRLRCNAHHGFRMRPSAPTATARIFIGILGTASSAPPTNKLVNNNI